MHVVLIYPMYIHIIVYIEVLVITYSCQILVIPADSGAIPGEITSQNFTPAMEFCKSGIYTGTVQRIDWNGMARESSDQNEHSKLTNMASFAFTGTKI